MDSEGLRHTA